MNCKIPHIICIDCINSDDGYALMQLAVGPTCTYWRHPVLLVYGDPDHPLDADNGSSPGCH